MPPLSYNQAKRISNIGVDVVATIEGKRREGLLSIHDGRMDFNQSKPSQYIQVTRESIEEGRILIDIKGGENEISE